MECTQRLECTQDLYDSPVDNICPEQIGFLGICGTKYPVKKGPNKIGRDPQTCSIVLQLESVSRQHAVINILNKTEYMLMDLDSANKTKLLGKTLQPYIPHPLKNGDTVQFGKIFGVFRLLQEDNELPMTQALDIPDTPIMSKHVSRVYNIPVTTIPESPEVSDRDDSFIAPSQPKVQKQFKDEAKHFIKPSTKTISIQPIGSKKIDNVFWNSSKRSTSIGFALDDSSKSMNDSAISLNKSSDINLHDMETQAPMENVQNISVDSIYTANTQMPNLCNQNENADTIYNANTQMPNTGKEYVNVNTIYNKHTQLPNGCNQNVSLDSIHTANTQAPSSPSVHNVDKQMPAAINLPNVRKVQDQHDMQFDFCVANKENDNNIFNAETQAFVPIISKKPEILNKDPKNSNTHKENSKSGLDNSREEILFEDIDNDAFEDEFESQSLLPESPKPLNKDTDTENNSHYVISISKTARRNARLKSDSSTDCDDIEIAPTQLLPSKPVEDDLTDCEDNFNDDVKKPDNLTNANSKFEEMLTQVLPHEATSKITNNNVIKCDDIDKLPIESSKVPFEDMLTQVIEDDNQSNILATIDPNFEEMPTQVICENNELLEKTNLEDLPTQVLQHDISDKPKEAKKLSNDFISPFKVPLKSPRKAKRKDTPKSHQAKEMSTAERENSNKKLNNSVDNYENYYVATQDILKDLCTQAQLSPEILPEIAKDNDIIPSSVEDFKTGDYKLPGLDFEISPKSSESNIDEKLNEFVTSLSKEQIQDVIGVQPMKRQASDPSDSEATPKKVHPMKLFETDLPNSQEIKTSVSLHYKRNVTESSSESETENETEDQFTPILYRKKSKPKVDAKIDLIKKLDVDALPLRVSTRVRKPAPRLQENEEVKKRADKILKPKFLTEQEGDISNEIIIENITRLKSKNDKNEKNKSNTEVTNDKQKSKNDSRTTTKSTNKTEHTKKEKRKSDDTKDKSVVTKSSDIKAVNSSAISSDLISERSKRSKTDHDTKDKRKNDDIKDKSLVSNRNNTHKSDVISIDLTDEKSKRSTRSTRYKQKQIDKEKRSESVENVKKDDDKRRHKSSEKEVKHDEDSKEVRRSRRQKSYKEKKANDSLIKVKITKPMKKEVKPPVIESEKSAVFSVSSDSGSDSPKRAKLKRAATETLRAPSAKRTRAPSPKRTRSLARATPARRVDKQRVLFTAFPCEEVKKKLESLGAEIVSDVTQCTVVLTLHIKRTFKLLCAVGLGRPIVGPAWVQACAASNTIVDPWQHLLKDEAAEKRFKFSLSRTLAGKRNFLSGYRVSSTPSVLPTTAEMILIVECSGGIWEEGGSDWLCVSCSADRALWPELVARGAVVVSTELVLAGVLRQELDVAGCRLA